MRTRNLTPVQRRIEQMRAAERYETNRAARDAKTPRIVCLFIGIEALCRTMIEALAAPNGNYDSGLTAAAHDRLQAYLGGLDMPH